QRPERTHRPGEKVTKAWRRQAALAAMVHLLVVKRAADPASDRVDDARQREVGAEHQRGRNGGPNALGTREVARNPVREIDAHGATRTLRWRLLATRRARIATGGASSAPAITSRM